MSQEVARYDEYLLQPAELYCIVMIIVASVIFSTTTHRFGYITSSVISDILAG